jgi:hypothetical protein
MTRSQRRQRRNSRNQSRRRQQSRQQSRRRQQSRQQSRQQRRRQQRGGRVLMPSEYFGHDSGRYYPAGSPELSSPLMGAAPGYGMISATSHGMEIGNSLIGPNLAPYPGTSGIQTGGRRH